jgi:glycosyltransferase A (GT-A) superfamily protein (DUF2064 family)
MPEELAIIVFLRHPTPGRTKTRLAAGIGAAAAARFYGRCAERIVSECLRCGARKSSAAAAAYVRRRRAPRAPADRPPPPPPAATRRRVEGAARRLLFADATEEAAVRAWLAPTLAGFSAAAAAARLLPQLQAPDLGDRMRAALADALAAGHRVALLVGSDVPGLDASTLRAAAAELLGEGEGSGDDSVIFGPARDGGFYLVGLRAAAAPAALFAGVRWSAAETRADAAAAARAAGLRVAAPGALPALADIDTRADLERWADEAETGGGDVALLAAAREALSSGG